MITFNVDNANIVREEQETNQRLDEPYDSDSSYVSDDSYDSDNSYEADTDSDDFKISDDVTPAYLLSQQSNRPCGAIAMPAMSDLFVTKQQSNRKPAGAVSMPGMGNIFMPGFVTMQQSTVPAQVAAVKLELASLFTNPYEIELLKLLTLHQATIDFTNDLDQEKTMWLISKIATPALLAKFEKMNAITKAKFLERLIETCPHVKNKCGQELSFS